MSAPGVPVATCAACGRRPVGAKVLGSGPDRREPRVLVLQPLVNPLL